MVCGRSDLLYFPACPTHAFDVYRCKRKTLIDVCLLSITGKNVLACYIEIMRSQILSIARKSCLCNISFDGICLQMRTIKDSGASCEGFEKSWGAVCEKVLVETWPVLC